MNKNKKKVSIIIPSFNEERVIKNTINRLIKYLNKIEINYEIIVVDDGSTDKTIEIIKKLSKSYKNLKILLRKKEPGFGYSLVDGSLMAHNPIIIWIMADASDDFGTIKKMLDKIDQGFDMVIGSRNVSGGSRGNQDKLKAIGSRLYSLCAKFLFCLPVYDITNAFRLFRKEMIEKIQLENNNFAISPEFAIKAHLRGYKLAEVATRYKDREFGEAKSKLFKMGFVYYCLLIKYFFKRK